jgi:hypothetical protein
VKRGYFKRKEYDLVNIDVTTGAYMYDKGKVFSDKDKYNMKLSQT